MTNWEKRNLQSFVFVSKIRRGVEWIFLMTPVANIRVLFVNYSLVSIQSYILTILVNLNILKN